MKLSLLSFISVILLTSFSFAATPDCMAKNQVLPVINEQVLRWKKQTPNQWKGRGHIEGTLTKIYPNKSGHLHIQVQIGQNSYETVEVIYNESFGKVRDLHVGSQVEACGDYITSKARAGKYPASPDGAILHWVHESPRASHEDGYMMIDGVVFGFRSGVLAPEYLEAM